MGINITGQTSIQATATSVGNLNGYFFDYFPTASAAYSTRKLSRTATLCMKVRRASDNATLDIGFSTTPYTTSQPYQAGLDVAAMFAFSTAGGNANLLVDTWYDQSGNGRNATQATTTSQPYIGSKSIGYYGIGANVNYPAIIFQGTRTDLTNQNGWLNLASAVGITNGGYYFNAYVSSYRDTYDSTQPYLLDWTCNGSNNVRHAIITGTGVNKQYYTAYSRLSATNPSTADSITSNISNTQESQIVTMMSSNNNTGGRTPYLNIYQNGVLGGTGASTGGTIQNANSNFARLGVGTTAGVQSFSGLIAEALFYNIDTTPYKTAIEQNINSVFQIY
jgi:hypothetical protein